MSRTLSCPGCQVVLDLPESAAGRKLSCPHCRAKFRLIAGGGPGPERMQTGLSLLDAVAAGSPVAANPAPAGDVMTLFRDDPGAARRRPGGAEARSKARRCPICGSVVSVGMSLCSTCGLDLETGVRIAIDDDLMAEAPVGPSGPPLHVAIVGGICLLSSVVLGLASAIGGGGWLSFVPVCLFGAFASIQFLRGRSARLLLKALSLGLMVNLVALVAMPLIDANLEPTVVERPLADDPHAAEVAIQSVTQRLDVQRLGWGLALLLAYPATALYLTSPAVRSHCGRRLTA